MTAFVALLRAVNVGGTGKLPMSELKAMCEALGFEGVRTYIASGNVVFTSRKSEVRGEEGAGSAAGSLCRQAGRRDGAHRGRNAGRAEGNPFPKAPGNRTVAIFLDAKPPADTLAAVRHRKDEEIGLGAREIYVHYGDGIGTSKLVIPAAKTGTARNMNTIATLAKMAADL